MRLILLPGITGGASLLAAQRAEFSQLLVPDWIDPEEDESLPSYAARMAKIIDPNEPCIVGGTSFGGMVAQEMAPHLTAVACVLVASVRHPGELPITFRCLKPLLYFGDRRSVATAHFACRWFGRAMPRPLHARLRQFAADGSRFLRWAYRAVLGWRPQTSCIPTYHIHGSSDRTLPIKRTQPTQVVTDGTHELTRSHPAEVNEFLRDIIRTHGKVV